MTSSTQKMKLSTILTCFVLSLSAVEAATSQTCSTKYVSTSTKVTRSTTSITKTATVTVTSPIYQTATIVDPATTTTKTNFVYSDTTFYYTKAGTTTTVPLPKGFTPMASAASATGIRPQKRGALDARATTSYPYQVACTDYNTVTSTSTYEPIYQVTTTTYTPTPRTVTSTRTFTTWRATTSSVSLATRTVHAACAPSASNIIDSFNSRSINLWDTDGFKHGIGGGFSSPSDPDFAAARAAAQSPFDCCEAVMALGWSGFQYYGSTGYSATCIGSSGADVANFFIGPYDQYYGHLWCGNGVGGNPEFQGFYSEANGFS